jgi:HK97 gp10 family phage protein
MMAALAPHEPGKPDLRDAMVISTSRGQDRNEAAVAIGPTRKGFYGSFQELGTKHHAAQPFVRPALDRNVQISLQILASAIWRELAAKGISRSSTTTGEGITCGPGGSTL